MAQDISGSIDTADITGGNGLNERSDHEDAWNSAITVLNNMLNGAQDFDTIIWNDLTTDPAAPSGNDVKIYNNGGTLYQRDASGISPLGVSDAAAVTYTPVNNFNWGGSDPGDVNNALDWLASRLVGRGYISGMEVNCTNDVQFGISEGECLDDTHSVIMRIPTYGVAISTSGIGGLDTGSAANNTWYYVWVCSGASGIGAVISLSASSPTLPAGYDLYKRRVGMVRVDNSGDLHHQRMIPGGGLMRHVFWLEDTTASPFEVASAINVATSPSWTTVDCSAVVPPTATMAKLSAYSANSSGTADVMWRRDSTDGQHFFHRTTSSSIDYKPIGDYLVSTTQTIDLSGSSNDEDLEVYVDGYVDNLTPDLVS